MNDTNLIHIATSAAITRYREAREDELAEVLDLLTTGQINPEDPRLDYAYHIADNVEKTLRHWNYVDIQSAYDRINGDHTSQPGDLSFYAEPEEIGRFIVGMGEVHGSGVTRIGVCGPLGEPGVGDDRRGDLYLTASEAKEIGRFLASMVVDMDALGGDPA